MDSLSVNGQDAENVGEDEYAARIALNEPVTKANIHAGRTWKSLDQEVSVKRALSETELVWQHQEEQLKAEIAEAQRIEDEKYQKDAKCRAKKEEERKRQEEKVLMNAKDDASADWLSRNKTKAFGACRSAVLSRLKSPSTAGFPFSEQETAIPRGGYIWVTGSVDAQNGFSAQIRSQYVCQFELQGSEWNIMDVSVF